MQVGSYQLRDRLGEGGGGQVFRADGPDGPVAIKILAPGAELDPAAQARFGREARALAALRCPGLVALLDHGIDDELGPYLVQPLLAGANLRIAVGGQRLGPEAAVTMAAPIVAALAAMHAAGFVHRDVKPDNVIAGPDGTITLIDLGLAWRADMTRHTETGAAVGTIGYMAPEQIEGVVVDAAVDVWAIGVMLHEWIAGARPFARARPSEEAVATLVGGAPRLDAIHRRVDGALAELVARCLTAEPGARPTAAALAAELDTLARRWTGGDAAARAAIVGDPGGYAAQLAPTRARQLADDARAAVARGEPFVALAACDRGLAHVADDPDLLALVAQIEADAGSRARTEAAAPLSSPGAVVATPVSAPHPPSGPSRRGRWLIAGGVAAIAAIALAAVVLRGDPAPPAPPPLDPKLGLVRDMVDLIGGVASKVERDEATAAAAPPPTLRRTPTTATGWLARARTEAPAAALRSVRQALALAPTWPEARREECRVLLELDDAGAGAACDAAVKLRVDDPIAQGLHGLALAKAGAVDDALTALSKAIAGDGDPRWRAARAEMYARRGDLDAAAADRRDACALGLRSSCP